MSMPDVLEMTVSPSYCARAARRIGLLKIFRAALIGCLFLAWTYGISVAVPLLERADGSTVRWILFFGMFTVPALVMLVLTWTSIVRLEREYDYVYADGYLEIFVSNGSSRRKLLVKVNCYSIAAFAPLRCAAAHSGRTIRATVGTAQPWALDVRHEGQNVRLLLQPNEMLCEQLKSFVK